MSILVVDSSVVVKWFVLEEHSVEACRWQTGPDEFHVPAVFLDIEVANILWKKLQRNLLTLPEASKIVAELPLLPFVRHDESQLLAAAFDIAVTHRRSVYDSLYLALAERLDGQMLTADQRLVNALAGTPLAHRVRHVSVSPP
jgi:predicted nucleic acid-binding protein